jgi:hypothetical protein
MRKLIFLLTILFSGNLLAQKSNVVPDTIVKLGGLKILCLIQNVSTTTVYYATPDKPKVVLKMDRKDVEKVIYKSGKVEKYNNAAFTMIDEGQWQAVLITKNDKDVQGMYKRKFITARSSPTSNKKKARENVIIKMQKQAANAGGSIVLITNDQFYGGFGDNPGYYLEGEAYGFEPLEDGTNVVVDPSKKDAQSNSKTSGNTQKTGNTTPAGTNNSSTKPASSTTTPASNTKSNTNATPASTSGTTGKTTGTQTGNTTNTTKTTSTQQTGNTTNTNKTTNQNSTTTSGTKNTKK